MLRIIVAALRAHPAQSITTALLAALAAGLSAVLPAYLVAAVEAGTSATVDAAPLPQRLVSVNSVVPPRSADTEGARRAARVRAALDRPGLTMVAGLRSSAQLEPDSGGQFATALAYRENVCAHLQISGSCPAGPLDALVSVRDAERLELRQGGRLGYFNSGGEASTLTITGIYQIPDIRDPYWTGGNLIRTNPVFVTPEAFPELAPPQVIATADGLITAALFADLAPASSTADLLARFRELRRDDYSVLSSAVSLGNRVTTNRQLLIAGVPAAGVQLLVLCWLALGLALRHAGAGWRADMGLLKLRGVASGRILALAFGRSAVPILAGAVAGVAAGVALIAPLQRLAGTRGTGPTLTAVAGLVPLAGVGAALLAVLGSLAVAVIAERRVLREPVLDLMRRVPQRGRGWRAGIGEAVVAVLAVAAVYQVRAVPAEAAVTAGLALFVPMLTALTVAVTGARLFPPAAGAFTRRAFGAGRVSTGLAVLDLARRPGARRLTALVTVAVALALTSGTAWSTAASARAERAGLELGADRVVGVVAENSTQLLAAVRAADPTGRYAMAVVSGRLGANSDAPAVLALDASRLVAVGAWGTSGQRADLARRVRPDAAAPVIVAGAAVELEVTVPAGASVPVAAGRLPAAGPVIELQLIDGRGIKLGARFGPLPPGRQAVRADTPACSVRPDGAADGAAAGCRLVSITVGRGAREGTEPVEDTGAAPATEPIVLHRLSQVDPTETRLDPAAFGSVARWRQPLGAVSPWLLFTGTADGLALRISALGLLGSDGVPPTPTRPGATPPTVRRWTVEVADAAVPLPGAASGVPVGARAGAPDEPLLGSTLVPVRLAAVDTPLPRVGDDGIVVDLEYADRVLGGGVEGAQEVWLARDAPADLVDRLRAVGLRLTGTDSIAAATGRYANHGGTAVLRINLVVALAGLVLAAGAVVLVGIVERPARAVESAALRAQGVPAAALHRAVRGGYAIAVGVAVGLGAAAALLARWLAGDGLPLFDDEWAVLAPPGPSWLALGLLGGALAVTLVPAVLAASRRPDSERPERSERPGSERPARPDGRDGATP